MIRRYFCVSLVAVGFGLMATGSIHAQAWLPTRPVEIISSTGVGGAQDRLARTLQSIVQTGKLVPMPMVVVNKPGGSGAISEAYLNRAPGDGHMLLVSSALMLTSHIMGRANYNYTDLSPIAQLFHEYSVLVVRAESPIKDSKDFIARIKVAADSVSVGVTVLGTAHHISIARAAKSAGLDPKRLKMVTFKAGSDALIATMGGHIDASVSSASNVLPYLENGTVRVIAISSPQRLAGPLATVPTWKEIGIDSVASNFRTVFGPRGLNNLQIAYWEQVLSKVTASEQWRKQVQENAWVEGFLGKEQTLQVLAQEYDALKGVMTDLGMAKK